MCTPTLCGNEFPAHLEYCTRIYSNSFPHSRNEYIRVQYSRCAGCQTHFRTAEMTPSVPRVSCMYGVYMYVCMYVCMYVYMNVCVHECMFDMRASASSAPRSN